jgi:hypothetical protein
VKIEMKKILKSKTTSPLGRFSNHFYLCLEESPTAEPIPLSSGVATTINANPVQQSPSPNSLEP